MTNGLGNAPARTIANVDRRTFLRSSAAVLATSAVGGLSACSRADDEVVVLGWSSYVAPEIASLMKKAGLSMRGIPAETDQDMFTKLKAGGAGSYDIVFANCGWSPTYFKAGLIEAFDIREVNGWEDIWPIFREDTTFPYVIEPNKVTLFPNMWDSLGLIWNVDQLSLSEPYSWNALWDERVPKGKVITKGGPEDFLAISGLSIGIPRERIYAMNGAELQAAAERLARLKPFQIGASDSSFEDAIRTGKAWVGQSSNLAASARINRVAQKQVSKCVVPKEGSLGWVDGPQLVRGAKNRKNALKFIEVWNSEAVQSYLYDTYSFPQCNKAATERTLVKGGDGATNLLDRGADDPSTAKHLLFQGPPDDPAAWTRAYDQVVGS
ncbi:ABC transporter substrate-binding protein [Rhizobium sp. YTU87027]|uniref:ABC transporter substrate-binding protein n=1 Tax=Rhizobium sp. YTU87027 TaxID=3417741 RepID=UPI003D680D81